MQRSDYVDTTLYTCLASIFFPHKVVFSSYCVHGAVGKADSDRVLAVKKHTM